MQAMTIQEPLDQAPFRGKLLINGEWCEAADGAVMERESPAHGKVVAVYAKADKENMTAKEIKRM